MDLKVLRERAMSDCPPEKSFWTCNGVICRNLRELADNIRAQNDWSFRYHVNDDNKKNDYADWIKDVIGDEELAWRLSAILDKKLYLDIIEQRIIELEEF